MRSIHGYPVSSGMYNFLRPSSFQKKYAGRTHQMRISAWQATLLMSNSEEKFLYAGGILHNLRDIGVNVLGLRSINLVRVDFFRFCN